MSLTVCVSATSTGGGSVTTTSRFRELLGVSSTYDDPLHQRLLNQATDWAVTFLGYPLLGPEVYLETVPAFGSRNLMLARTPIRHVFRLFDSTDTGSATEYLSSQYRLEDADAGFLSRDIGWNRTPHRDFFLADIEGPDMRRPWMVEYAAGYVGIDGKDSTTDGTTSTGQTLPGAIESAVLFKAKDWLEGGGTIREKAIGDLRLVYATAGQDGGRLDLAAELLMPYRRIK